MLFGRAIAKYMRHGRLTVIDAGGSRHEAGGGDGPEVQVRLTDRALHRRLLTDPELALGEAYMDGTLSIERGTLREFLDVCAANLRAVEASAPVRLLDAARRLRGLLAGRYRLGRSRRNVAHHYDLKGELFDLFLDGDRQYSCAYFADPADDIDTAQRRKKVHIAAKLLLGDGQRVLDIGSGWGGLGLFLCGIADVSVEGVTLSEEQHKVSNERAWRAGLSERARFHLRDYRRLDGGYDRIVSVGMLEHVGRLGYREYYEQVARLLRDDGVALIHCIGKYGEPSEINPWIEKYIFPGGYLPTLSEQMPHIERAGLLVTDVEVLRLHYAETLRLWNEGFQRNRARAAAMYDERFCRMWEFYLAACEMAFRHAFTMVFQIQLAKSLDAVPPTRDYIGEFERVHGAVPVEARASRAAGG